METLTNQSLGIISTASSFNKIYEFNGSPVRPALVAYHSPEPTKIAYQYAISIASSFTTPEELISRDLIGFSMLIQSRISYLDSLKNLGDNWISGDSKQPNENIIEIGKKLLVEISVHFWKVFTLSFPNIIMGPLPSGGISFEIKYNNDALFLNIHNNGEYEIETLIQDHYCDITSVNEENFVKLVLNFISNYGSGGYNSGWRKAI